MKFVSTFKIGVGSASLVSICLGAFVCASCALADPSSAPAPAKPPAVAMPPDVPANHPAAPAVGSMIKMGIMKAQPDGKFHGKQPVTRYELAVVLDRFVNYIEESRKPIKSSVYPAPKSSVTAPVGTAAYDAQVHLLLNGFIPISSPLLKSPVTGTVTAQDLATILAGVAVRLSDRNLSGTNNADPLE